MKTTSIYDNDEKAMVTQTRFPGKILFGFYLALLLMAGVQCGLVVLIIELHFHVFFIVLTIMAYWLFVAAILTSITLNEIKHAYEDPLKELVQASKKVAKGDFTINVPLLHTSYSLDYLDVLILNFNRMVEKLGSLETLKVDFFSNVSHEMKTPISVIQSAAQMLQSDLPSDEQKKSYIIMIIQASRRLTGLITNMLKLNKLEKQDIKPSIINFDICEQLRECIIQFYSNIEEKKIDFDADIESRRQICTDPELLELVWTNLLSNAVKFTNENGFIRVHQYVEHNTLSVEVINSGHGMSEDTMKHVFDKFYQGDTSHSTEGNGLGLALCHRIMETLHGTITVESDEDKSTVFKVTLPL